MNRRYVVLLLAYVVLVGVIAWSGYVNSQLIQRVDDELCDLGRFEVSLATVVVDVVQAYDIPVSADALRVLTAAQEYECD